MAAFSLLQPPRDGPRDELVAALRDDVGLLLRDRLDRRIRLGELDAPQPVEDPHHLFLIDHHAVGLFQDFLEHGMEVGRLLAAVLDVDVFVDHAAVERAGPIEGIGGDDVGEAVGLHLDQEVADAGRFELEDALGLAALEELEGRWDRPGGDGRGRSGPRDAAG